jgi:uncharacterized protein (TIGR00297 family)
MMNRPPLYWQSKLVLLLVVPAVAAGVVLQARWWAVNIPLVAMWAMGLSVLLGLVAWKAGTATPWAAATGTAIAASMAFSTATYPYMSWQTGLLPLLTLLVLTSLATRVGLANQEEPEAAPPHGRNAAQVAANLGVAALMLHQSVLFALERAGVLQISVMKVHGLRGVFWSSTIAFSLGLAALAESAADTVSSEIGQVLGGAPRLLTNWRKVEPGTDGAISWLGTAVGSAAAALVAAAGALALRGGVEMFGIALGGGVFGLFFDSLLGATLERKGWLNNDAVNFLSTLSAAGFALLLLLFLPHTN